MYEELVEALTKLGSDNLEMISKALEEVFTDPADIEKLVGLLEEE